MKATITISILALIFTVAASKSSMRPAQQHEGELVTIDTLNSKFEMNIDSIAEPLTFREYEPQDELPGQRQTRFGELESTHKDQIVEHMKDDQAQVIEANKNFLGSF